MSLEVYPSDFHTRYEISHAIAVQMSVYYNDIGKISIDTSVTEENIAALKVGNLVYDTDRDTTYVIANTIHNTEGNRITANGYTADWLLNNRCIALQAHITNVEAGAYAVINENLRGLPRFQTAAVTGLPEATEALLEGGQILDELTPIFEEKGLGRKMIWNPDTLSHTFKIYKGRDLTQGIHAVVFSEEQGSAQELVIQDDDSTFKNVAYITGQRKDADKTRFIEIVGDATGESRREFWVTSVVTQESDEADVDFIARVREAAAVELSQRIRRQSFSVSVDANDLGKQFDLGDIVSCVSVRFGVTFDARITGVKYIMDTNSVRTEVVLGDPILTAIGELKLNG